MANMVMRTETRERYYELVTAIRNARLTPSTLPCTIRDRGDEFESFRIVSVYGDIAIWEDHCLVCCGNINNPGGGKYRFARFYFDEPDWAQRAVQFWKT